MPSCSEQLQVSGLNEEGEAEGQWEMKERGREVSLAHKGVQTMETETDSANRRFDKMDEGYIFPTDNYHKNTSPSHSLPLPPYRSHTHTHTHTQRVLMTLVCQCDFSPTSLTRLDDFLLSPSLSEPDSNGVCA